MFSTYCVPRFFSLDSSKSQPEDISRYAPPDRTCNVPVYSIVTVSPALGYVLPSPSETRSFLRDMLFAFMADGLCSGVEYRKRDKLAEVNVLHFIEGRHDVSSGVGDWVLRAELAQALLILVVSKGSALFVPLHILKLQVCFRCKLLKKQRATREVD